MPSLWLVAGPNGSGKTTLARETPFRELIGATRTINADDITAEIRATRPSLTIEQANLAGARALSVA